MWLFLAGSLLILTLVSPCRSSPRFTVPKVTVPHFTMPKIKMPEPKFNFEIGFPKVNEVNPRLNYRPIDPNGFGLLDSWKWKTDLDPKPGIKKADPDLVVKNVEPDLAIKNADADSAVKNVEPDLAVEKAEADSVVKTEAEAAKVKTEDLGELEHNARKPLERDVEMPSSKAKKKQVESKAKPGAKSKVKKALKKKLKKQLKKCAKKMAKEIYKEVEEKQNATAESEGSIYQVLLEKALKKCVKIPIKENDDSEERTGSASEIDDLPISRVNYKKLKKIFKKSLKKAQKELREAELPWASSPAPRSYQVEGTLTGLIAAALAVALYV